MRTSNINIVKGEIEFADIQEDINKERAIEREQNAAGGNANDQMVNTLVLNFLGFGRTATSCCPGEQKGEDLL